MPPTTPDPMSQIQPVQFAGLLFGVGLVLVVFIIYNFRLQLWTAARWCAAVMRQAIAARAVLVVNVSGVNTFEDDEEEEEGPDSGEITSTAGSLPLRTGSEPGDPPLVSPDTDAERTGSTETIEPPPAVISHKMSTPDLIVFLAVQKDDSGNYRWSANKIVEFVGGTRADVIARIAAVRVKPTPAQPSMSGRVERPQGGW